MTDLISKLRQGVVRQDAIYLIDRIDMPLTEALMAAAADELERLRKIEAAAQALSNFNGGLFEFNIRLRTLKAAVETDTDD